MLAEKIVVQDELKTVRTTKIGCGLTLEDYIHIMYPKPFECGYVALAHKEFKKVRKLVFEQKTLKKLKKQGKKAEEIYEMVMKGEIKQVKESPYNFIQRCYPVNELLNHMELDKDCYLSTNTFFITRRRKSDVRHLNALFTDIDYYNLPGVTKETVLEVLQFNIDKGLIPPPTFVIDSGQGIYLIWKIEDCPGKFVRVAKLYATIQAYIYDLFKDVGADAKAKDASRILRVPSSKNTKVNRKAKVIEYNEDALYTLRFFQEYVNVFEEYSTVPKAKKKKQTNIKHLFNTYTLHVKRMRDLEMLVKLRNYDVKGLRDHFIFLYYYYNLLVHQDKNVALYNTKDLNNSFKEPLEDSEVRSFIVSAERSAIEKIEGKNPSSSKYKLAGYNYKNETLIELFGISEEEEKHLQTIISKNEKYRRNNEKRRASRRNEEGLTKREQDKQYLVERVKQLKERGYKQREIAEMFEISKGRVSQILKEIKKV